MLLRSVTKHVTEKNWFAVQSNLVPMLRVVMHRFRLAGTLFQSSALVFISNPINFFYLMIFQDMHYHAGAWQSRKFDAMFGDCRVVPPRNDEQLFRLMEID